MTGIGGMFLKCCHLMIGRKLEWILLYCLAVWLGNLSQVLLLRLGNVAKNLNYGSVDLGEQTSLARSERAAQL